MSDHDLIREARTTSLPTPLSLTRRLADRLEAANTRANKLEKALREIEARHTSTAGIRGTDAEIARAALAKISAEPAEENEA